MRALRLWIGRVVPLRYFLEGAAACAAAVALALAARAFWGPRGEAAITAVSPVAGLFAVMGGFGYGGFRGSFLPFPDTPYRAWLLTTPYDGRKPLPLGPVHLVPQDLLVLGALEAVLVAYGNIASGMAVAFFLAIYTVFGTVFAWNLGIRIETTGALAMGAVAVLVSTELLPVLICFLVAYGLIFVAIRRALPRLAREETGVSGFGVLTAPETEPPRDDTPGNIEIDLSNTRGTNAEPSLRYGWPLGPLSPVTPRRRIPLREGAILSALSGLYFYAAGERIVTSVWADAPALRPADWPERIAVSFLVAILAVCAVWRLFIFWKTHRSPISPLGRLFTGRFVVPGYDKVFLSPLLAMAVAPVLALPLLALGAPVKLVVPTAVALGLFIAIEGPPSYAQWHLTGHYRLVPELTVRMETAAKPRKTASGR